MPSDVRPLILTLYICLAWSFGMILGAAWGTHETRKAYGQIHYYVKKN